MSVENILSKSISKDLPSTLDSFVNGALADLNCVKIGIVDEYYPEERTAKVLLSNKRCTGFTGTGVQLTREYPPIYPRVMFIGTVDNGIDYKVQKGDEVLVFFCDRELESWWLTGEVSQLNSLRTHHLSDCVAIAGLRSQPLTTKTDSNLNIKSNGMGINIEGNSITINADSEVKINSPSITTSGNLSVGTGISAVVPCGAVTLTFSNGILTGVS